MDLVLQALRAHYVDELLTLEEFERRVDLHLRQREVHAEATAVVDPTKNVAQLLTLELPLEPDQPGRDRR